MHLTGGISGLVGAVILGPRLGKEKIIKQVNERRDTLDSERSEKKIETYESVT